MHGLRLKPQSAESVFKIVHDNSLITTPLWLLLFPSTCPTGSGGPARDPWTTDQSEDSRLSLLTRKNMRC